MLDSSGTFKPRPDEHRLPFERIALLLQGGGALGAYQGGVYQALDEADLLPDWVAGISIGAINSALIAGNPPEKRVEKLREFWELVSAPPMSSFGVSILPPIEITDPSIHRVVNQVQAYFVALLGAPNFFTPRLPPPVLFHPDKPDGLSFYDTAPLRKTLERLVDFDRINAGPMRFSVGAVHVRSGNFVYFDTTTHRIGPEHVIGSGSLPPGFPPTEIDGEYYWDGGIVSNTPLQWVLDSRPRQDTLAFQVDLWHAAGQVPRSFSEASVREKEIRYSSRTRAATDQYRKMQKLRIAVAELIKDLPEEHRDRPEVRLLEAESDDKVCNIIQLIYRSESYEGLSKDYEFSRATMEEHWRAGYNDAIRTLSHPEVLECPGRAEGVRTFDVARATQQRHKSELEIQSLDQRSSHDRRGEPR
ncbi:DUF3734 domain-containing protein [Methylocapsa acidiphila]|uniref:DUF3734 domain-containing protein n=1 Tax=Methylocapsa acidiphila TaxID=133552 RepID=UPI00042851B3|nr:DUF3734 domain-containing protein [Methylocapsa acidiphila]